MTQAKFIKIRQAVTSKVFASSNGSKQNNMKKFVLLIFQGPTPPAGYAVFEAETMEAAIELAARIPAARLGGAVEIRPADKYW